MYSEIILSLILIILVIWYVHSFESDQNLARDHLTTKSGKQNKKNKSEEVVGEAIRKPTRKRIETDTCDVGTGLANHLDINTGSDKTIDTDEDENKTFEFYDEQNIFRSFVDENKLKTYIEESGVLRGLVNYIKENIGNWKCRRLNIAVIGNAGTGKSSLINAIRGVKPNGEGAARVGVTETTRKIERYSFPGNDNVVLWDLPGVGTSKQKRKDYLSNVDILQFEILIIVSATRFTENEIWLAKKALHENKYIFFVRSKLDIDMENEKEDHPDRFDVEDLLKTMKEEIKQNLVNNDILNKKTEVYLLSSRKCDMYEFPEMFDKLKNVLNVKANCMQKILLYFVKNAVEKQREKKKEEFLISKIFTAVMGFIPTNLNDIHRRFVQNMRENCVKRFCLDDDCLVVVSEELDITIEVLKKEHLKYFDKCQKKKSSWFDPRNLLFHFDICETLAIDEYTLIELRIKKLGEQLSPFET